MDRQLDSIQEGGLYTRTDIIVLSPRTKRWRPYNGVGGWLLRITANLSILDFSLKRRRIGEESPGKENSNDLQTVQNYVAIFAARGAQQRRPQFVPVADKPSIAWRLRCVAFQFLMIPLKTTSPAAYFQSWQNETVSIQKTSRR